MLSYSLYVRRALVVHSRASFFILPYKTYRCRELSDVFMILRALPYAVEQYRTPFGLPTYLRRYTYMNNSPL